MAKGSSAVKREELSGFPKRDRDIVLLCFGFRYRIFSFSPKSLRFIVCFIRFLESDLKLYSKNSTREVNIEEYHAARLAAPL